VQQIFGKGRLQGRKPDVIVRITLGDKLGAKLSHASRGIVGEERALFNILNVKKKCNCQNGQSSTTV